ncbi:hypothetical protein ASPWEDRAFT_169098 [Aspergillus wentii DTO 134E9]|uniref:Uncharacterized protein n=1 Tax=Aspergillus wentii DTO 134E9 TaxID=1073089 RepID=A0A1L9RWB6_ASPWE|nr:uncharacterized protein ASPWEDRAFT_169098 [Aspergillus wentii DTO 134E9]KAI9929065.1 hypothetical protein MW887_001460 [Aspergillus wentii]OJJ39241.1 hypothetical protein ASPWEDRAFT_169098 [Aspergillus wentii DTO 134E9]
MIIYACNHRGVSNGWGPYGSFSLEVTPTGKYAPCLCKSCHYVIAEKQVDESREILRANLDVLDRMLDVAHEKRYDSSLDSATIMLELHRLHACRNEAKERHAMLKKETWRYYRRRWGLEGWCL